MSISVALKCDNCGKPLVVRPVTREYVHFHGGSPLCGTFRGTHNGSLTAPAESPRNGSTPEQDQ